ncbi:unnamed protein product [Rhodiola kirilowii]
MEGGEQKGLEGTGLKLEVNRHGNLTSVTSDESFTEILQTIKASKKPAVIKYGASWCRVCSQMLPAFFRMSNEFNKLAFIYADIDECPETTQHIRYTPTFQFYRNGERVDEMYGIGEERLHDRLWLHS